MKRIGTILCALILLSAWTGISAGEAVETGRDGIYLYTLREDGGAVIVGLDGDFSGTLMIADTLDGHPVAEIGDAAMMDRDGITAVMIPGGVERIGDYSFCGCDRLRTVMVSPGVGTIGVSAFMFCRELSSVSLGEGIAEIGAHAFCGCSALSEAVVPASAVSFGAQCFSDCAADLVLSGASGSPIEAYCADNGIAFSQTDPEPLRAE